MNVPCDDDLGVAQRDRISIDVSDIKEAVENCRDDVAWNELPLAAKLRVLIKERLEQIEEERLKGMGRRRLVSGSLTGS